MQANLYILIAEEEEKLVAYPALEQSVNGNTNFLALVKPKSKNPCVVSVLHRNNLKWFDVKVMPYDCEYSDDAALVLALNNMIVAPRYDYMGPNTDQTYLFDDLLYSLGHVILRLLEEGNGQKFIFNTITSIFGRMVPILALTHIDAQHLFEMIDSMLEELVNDQGIFTKESIESCFNQDNRQLTSSETDIDFESEDKDFFDGLFQ